MAELGIARAPRAGLGARHEERSSNGSAKREVRLDAELVRRGLARSRGHAVDLVAERRVLVDGSPARRASVRVGDRSRVEVAGAKHTYVSRGAHKLIGALDEFAAGGLRIAGRRCLDAGASTGGFTEVLLERGADHVVAADVGTGQLAPAVRDHPAVSVRERTNLRHVPPGGLGAPVDLVVGDLSFISLRLLLPALRGLATEAADFVLLVKPQFEVGPERVNGAGLVVDVDARDAAMRSVLEAAAGVGLGPVALTRSPLPGGGGNREYFVWLSATARPYDGSGPIADRWSARIAEVCADPGIAMDEAGREVGVDPLGGDQMDGGGASADDPGAVDAAGARGRERT